MTGSALPDERVAARIVAENDRWRFTGALTFDDAAEVFDAGKAMPLPPSGIVDLGGLTHADSSALAVVLAVKRRAALEGRTLQVRDVPASLRSLAIVYGVDGLLA
jgi:phospholipid transport system transporter-binding protein